MSAPSRIAGFLRSLRRLTVPEIFSIGFGLVALLVSGFTLYLQFYRVTQRFRAIILQAGIADSASVAVKLALVNSGDRQILVMRRFLSASEPDALTELEPDSASDARSLCSPMRCS
jgi:hypothetical protein